MKALEIGVFAGAAVAALAGAFAAASSFLGGDDAPGAAPPQAQTEAAPANTAQVRNSRYGFRFRYPKDWQPTRAPDPRVVELVQRNDSVACMVSVHEQALPSDVTGKPKNLGRLLAMSSPAQLGTASLPGAKISSFEKSTLGGQEARFFKVEVAVPGAGLGKFEVHATLRSFGAVVLLCLAPDTLARDSDVQDAFKLARTSFSFD